MENKQLALEHEKMLRVSREMIILKIPREINVMFFIICSLILVIFGCTFSIKINDVIKVNGIVKTLCNNSSVNNVISGEIEKIFFEEGQFVEKGDLLYCLKRDSFDSVLRDQEEQVSNIKEELFCIEKLLDSFFANSCLVAETDSLLAYSKVKEYLDVVDYYNQQIEILEYKYKKELCLPESVFSRRNADEAFMNLALCKQELEKYKSAFLADLMNRKKNYETELSKLEHEMFRTKEQNDFLEIRAPISGYVQEISSLNEGDYLFSNQEVLVIVPNDAKNFKVELMIPTKDIGEITDGMKVKYRLSAFPFFEYKGTEGEITAIDSDVRQNGSNRLYYRVYSDIEKTSFTNLKGKEYPLRAGIEVDARIILEKISLVHFILRKMDFMQ